MYVFIKFVDGGTVTITFCCNDLCSMHKNCRLKRNLLETGLTCYLFVKSYAVIYIFFFSNKEIDYLLSDRLLVFYASAKSGSNRRGNAESV